MVLLSWIIFAVVVGSVAGKYGRSSLGWFLLALLISPLLAIIFLLIAGNTLEGKVAEQMLLEEMKARRRHDALVQDVTARAHELAASLKAAREPPPVLPNPAPAVRTWRTRAAPWLIVTLPSFGLVVLLLAILCGHSQPPSPAGPEWNRTQQPVDLHASMGDQRAFTDGQLCRAAVATSVAISPREIMTEAEERSYVTVSRIRATDGKAFRYSCAVLSTYVQVSDPFTGKPFQNIVFGYRITPDGMSVEVTMTAHGELMERRTFTTSDFSIEPPATGGGKTKAPVAARNVQKAADRTQDALARQLQQMPGVSRVRRKHEEDEHAYDQRHRPPAGPHPRGRLH